MQFLDIKGQQKIKRQLIYSVKNNHIAHAQLFSGKKGSANLALAWAYATYINCNNRIESDSCGICNSCLKYKKLIHPDFHLIFPTTNLKDKKNLARYFLIEWRKFISNNPYASLEDWIIYSGGENKNYQISKEENKYIVKNLSLSTLEGNYKIILIWLPEFMHPFAANAILKILEEPPKKTVFLLVSSQADMILNTILSRTQVLNIPEFSNKEIQSFLTENLKVETQRAEELAHLAQNDLNEAIKLNKGVEDNYQEWFQEWMRSCFKADYTALYNRAESFYQMSKQDQKNLLQYGMKIFRECIIIKYADNQLLRTKGKEKIFIENFSKILNSNKIEYIIELFNRAFLHIGRNVNAKILMMNLSIENHKIFTCPSIYFLISFIVKNLYFL